RFPWRYSGSWRGESRNENETRWTAGAPGARARQARRGADARARGRWLLLKRCDPQLAGPREDGVLDVRLGPRLDRGVHPVAGARIEQLAEDRRAHAVGAQVAAEDVDVDLEALVGRLRRRIPVSDDHAAEGVGRGQRHEGNRVERGAPQIGVDADTTVTAGAGPPFFLAADADAAAAAKQRAAGFFVLLSSLVAILGFAAQAAAGHGQRQCQGCPPPDGGPLARGRCEDL